MATTARVNPAAGTEFFYLRQADATSTATVSTSLDNVNTDEAAGSTYDGTNAALDYSGTRTHAGPSSGYTSGDYDQTESWSQQAGASMTATFTGTAVQWIGPKNTNGGIADVYLDGTQVATVDTYSPAGKLFQQVLYSTTGLPSGSHTLTITVSGTQNPASSADTVVVDAINVPTAAQLASFFPAIPQQPGTSVTLDGRDSRMLTANYDFAGQHLVYSTSELDTQATIGGRSVALLYDPAGTDGETVLQYASQPAVTVLSGTVSGAWDPGRGQPAHLERPAGGDQGERRRLAHRYRPRPGPGHPARADQLEVQLGDAWSPRATRRAGCRWRRWPAPASAGGLTFTWPDVASAEPDNTMAEGQTIAISGSGASLGFLAAANNSAEPGTGTIYYTDGSTQSFTLDAGNFWYPAGQDGNPANVQVAGVDYANYPTGSSGHEVYVFEQSVPLAAGKTVAAVMLPSLGGVAGYNAALHVFALAIG
ncbi:MAG TPA: hypothetical protein VMH35_03465 [Streptosporangiaceae bacterium]|nr:hypothetical protein [Streptosporangiaceae bacterium]